MYHYSNLKPYQHKAIYDQGTRWKSILWVDMGMGKTIITLTNIKHLLRSNQLKGVLVVAPLRVVLTGWRQEALKWSFVNDLTFSVITGDKDQRTRALVKKADIHLINYENVEWLSNIIHVYYTSQGRDIPFDGLVWDEITKMKNASADRVRAYLKIENYFKWVTGLTGTPASNNYIDTHGQFLVVDKGEALFRTKTEFETKYYYRPTHGSAYAKVPFDNTVARITEAVSHMTIVMNAKDHNPLPEMIVNDIIVNMSEADQARYDQMEKEFYLQSTEEGEWEVELLNKGVLLNKALQYSNGSVYIDPVTKEWKRIHDVKLDALEDIIEEANGNQVLCAYAFRSDAERIMKKFKRLKPVNLTLCKTQSTIDHALDRWKSGNCPLMIGHPASMGHGIDGLQHKGNILVWFGLNWSLEYYLQFNSRIVRQGQKQTTVCHRILCSNTFDELQAERLSEKETNQEGLSKSVKEYGRKKYGL